ncbi:MAG: 4Fe-4S dicluster domain-containing protein [Acidobacteriota bacterium]
MKWSQYIVTLIILVVLTVLSVAIRPVQSYSGVAWFVWLTLAGLSTVGLALWLSYDTLRTKIGLKGIVLSGAAPDARIEAVPTSVVDPNGPSYPHPVINTQTCIGCHACVDACPHDVLAISGGKATPIAVEQCMEDTSCQVECPTVPKSCVVFNTTKKIPARKVPQRDQRFCTNVPGIFLIGDVSGVPLIKNAINEGGAVVDFVARDLEEVGGTANGDYDLAIIGLGPAGLSAVVTAEKRGLKYVALDQEQVLATIQQTYQAGKYVYFNPTDKETQGGIVLDGPGSVKEDMVR